MLNKKIIPIKQVLSQNSTHDITVSGWIKTKRDSKEGLSFLQLNDGSCLSTLQIIAKDILLNYKSEILTLTSGCAIIAHGNIVKSKGKNQSIEMLAIRIEVLGWVEEAQRYPIQPKRHTLEFLRDNLHLRPRTNIISAITRIRSKVSNIINNFLNNEGFHWIHTPIITSNDCEGAGKLFRVSVLDKLADKKNYQKKDFFGRETFLTVSGQLNVESFCVALSKVYSFGPTFRAENSNTSRHLAEFWMVEPEIAFADLYDIIDFSKKMLRNICAEILDKCSEDMQFFNQFIDPKCIQRLSSTINIKFNCITYTEAIRLLKKSKQNFTFPIKWGSDLRSEHERYLSEIFFKSPVIIIDYPKDIKGFYMRLNDDQKTVAAFDILMPNIGEVIGGSQREERYEILKNRIEEYKMDPVLYSWYLDLRKYGTVPHAGFGLGLERILSYITGMGNVRDLIPYPRTPGNAKY